MLAGLSKCDSLSIPPCFWENAGAAAEIAVTRATTAITYRKVIAISFISGCCGYWSSQTSSMRQPL